VSLGRPLQRLASGGVLERVAHGVYKLAGASPPIIFAGVGERLTPFRTSPGVTSLYQQMTGRRYPHAARLNQRGGTRAGEEGNQCLPSPSPSAKAFGELRRRIGAAPLTALCGVLTGPVAQLSTPGVRFGRYRMVGLRRVYLDQGPRHP
jgi:hypothetical protein